MEKLSINEIIYLRELLKSDAREIQADLNGGADEVECERDLKANKSLMKKLGNHIEKNFY